MKIIDKVNEMTDQREEMFKHEEANWPLVSAIKLMRWTLFMYLIAFIALYFICTWGINALSGFIFMGYFVIGNWLLGYVGVKFKQIKDSEGNVKLSLLFFFLDPCLALISLIKKAVKHA
mgnify:CR=1 FL=1